MKNKIVITGITGFVGQNLRKYLDKNFDILGVSRNKAKDEINYEDFFKRTLDYDSIIHLAGKAHDLKKTSDDSEYFEINFELTKKLYDHFLQSDAKQFIYVSSVKAAADTVDGILTEDVIANPVTVYGKSKLMAEEYILSNLSNDKKVFILRPCMIHGPGNKGNLNLLFNLVKKGFPWPLGAFDNKRSFLSVENFCFSINELLINNLIPSGVYNIADNNPISTNELIAIIGDSLNKSAKIYSIPNGFISLLAKTGDFLKLPLNTERLQKLTESYVVSNNKIVSAIKKPLPVDVKDGLMKTLKSF